MLNDDLTQEQYTEMYKRNVLSQHYPSSIVEKIRRLSQGKDCALLCYEKPGEFCHRHILADWLNKELNAGIEEYDVGGEEAQESVQQQLLF